MKECRRSLQRFEGKIAKLKRNNQIIKVKMWKTIEKGREKEKEERRMERGRKTKYKKKDVY